MVAGGSVEASTPSGGSNLSRRRTAELVGRDSSVVRSSTTPSFGAGSWAVLAACPHVRDCGAFRGRGFCLPRTTAALAGPWAHSVLPGAPAARSQAEMASLLESGRGEIR